MQEDAQGAPPGDMPEKLGKYHVLGIAGRGNMGVVYTGYDPYQDRDVAIKMCSARQATTARSPTFARKLFFNEAHTAGILDHPNILKVLDAGEQDDDLYIVMEYVDGGDTLADHCKPETLLPIKTVAEVIFTCANALDYAHRRGVVHRDIKPSNILFTREGTLKIADFGIAQRAFADTTQVIGLMGTPSYMSPEQVREGALTGQTDLYSLGVMMYELLTGRVPFAAQNLSHLIHKIGNEEPASVRTLRPEVPEALDAIVTWALNKETAARYATGRELASDLAAVFTELEQTAHEIPDDERFRSVRGLEFFAEFSDGELWEVLRASTWQTYSPGDAIITEGTTDLSFYVIVGGEVNVSKRGVVVRTLVSGDCFGEMGFLGGSARSATIVAGDEVAVMKLSATLLEQASTECQLRFNRAFIRVLVHRLSRTSDELTDMLEDSSPANGRRRDLARDDTTDDVGAHANAGTHVNSSAAYAATVAPNG